MTEYIQHGNALIKVFRPVLTEEEQKKRENQIQIALQQFGKAMQDAERITP